MKTELIVFDIAGTTLKDNEDIVGQSFLDAFESNGFSFGETDVNSVMGYKKIEAIRILLKEQGIKANGETTQKIHDDFLNRINEFYAAAPIEEIDGTSEVFESLKSAGIKIALNTGFSRSTTDIIIDRMEWKKNNLIDTSIASDEVDNGRPSPEMIRNLMKQFQLTAPSAVAKAGDTPSDLMEGQNAGCGLVIGVLYGTHTREQLEDYEHDYLIDDIREIKSILRI